MEDWPAPNARPVKLTIDQRRSFCVASYGDNLNVHGIVDQHIGLYYRHRDRTLKPVLKGTPDTREGIVNAVRRVAVISGPLGCMTVSTNVSYLRLLLYQHMSLYLDCK